MYEDKTLVCKDCGQEFVWTAGEQEFYASRGFENAPQRCKACRDARRTLPVVSARCTRLPVQLAARPLACPSSPVRIAPFTAASASLR